MNTLPANDPASPCTGDYDLLPDVTRKVLPQAEVSGPVTEPVQTLDLDPEAVPPPAHGPPPGYELLEAVGEGGMGVVYRARDLGMGREVAVKILHDKYAPTSAAAVRFVEEAKITGQLQHPGIPPVYHVGTREDGRPFLAMKLIKGQTLDHLLKARVAVAYLPVFEAICHAVGYAHAHHVLHRDLKPANIMVGAFGEVQVMDWGLAKVLASGVSSTPCAEIPIHLVETLAPTEIRPGRDSATHAGAILGTPSYMAPEQAAGEIEKIDCRTDVFGLGAILCTMLTGQAPYEGTAVAVLAAAVRGQTAGAFKHLDACGAEPEVVSLCKRCLSFDPTDRPAHGNALAQAVAALRIAAEERAKQAELDRVRAEVRETEQRRRRRLLLIAGLVVVGILLAGIVGTTWGLLHAEDQWHQAESAQAREAQQRRLAEEQKEQAIRARNDAEAAQQKTMAALRAATDDVVDQLIGSKQNLGPKERAYLEAALQRWQQFAAEHGDSVLARTMRAEGEFRVAQLQAKFGLRPEAEKGYRTAISLWTKLVAEFPAVPEYRQQMAWSHNNLGRLLLELGQRAEAQTQFEQALALHKKLVAEHPTVPGYREDLARHHDNLGNLLTGLGKGVEAQTHCEQALALRAQLAAECPDVPNFRYQLAASHHHLGFLLAELGKRAESLAQYEQALAIQTKLAAERPDVPHFREHLAMIHDSLGNLLVELGRRAEARTQFGQALAIHARLAAEYPAVPAYQVSLGGTCCNIGTLLGNGGKPADSLPWYDKAIAALEPVVTHEPRHELAHTFLRNSYGGRAWAYDQVGKYAVAVQDWEKVIALSPKEEQTGYRPHRAYSRSRQGQVAEAVAEIAAIWKVEPGSAEGWYCFARFYAAASGKFPDLQQIYADRAMELLQKAVQTGFKDAERIKKIPDLDPLRGRPDFQKLLESLPPTK